MILDYIPSVLFIPCKQPAGAKPNEYSNSLSTLRVLNTAKELIEKHAPDLEPGTTEYDLIMTNLDDLAEMIRRIK